MDRVAGKVALITGAARGQGRSHAVRLAEEGADIIAIDLCEEIPGLPYRGATESDLKETVRLVEAQGRRCFARKADVRNYGELKAATDAGVDELGRLDIVVANAGVTVDPARAAEIDDFSWENTVDINLSGVWRTCKAAIPHLEASRGGSIVITSSSAGLQGYENAAEYVASKHGVVGLMRTLALELARDFIRVNCVNPSQVDTDMIQHQAYYDLFCPDIENPGREQFASASQAMHAIPVPWVESIDVSNAVLFLVSDEARYITGVTLPVDLGCVIK
jgi:(+)-trans-carveol dehydrogenase